MNFLEQWIEYDFNPFVIFDNSGKVISLNQEAQFLLGEIPKEEVFELAKLYAKSTYGFKTTLCDVKFGSYNFFGFTVGYESDENIGIKLYRHSKQIFNESSLDKDKVNIYTILDLCMSAAATNNNATFTKEFDPTLPTLWLNLKSFVKLVTKVYDSHKNSLKISTKLKVKTGEYIKYENKKYPIFSLSISSDSQNKKSESSIMEFGKNSDALIYFDKNETIIEMPLRAY